MLTDDYYATATDLFRPLEPEARISDCLRFPRSRTPSGARARKAVHDDPENLLSRPVGTAEGNLTSLVTPRHPRCAIVESQEGRSEVFVAKPSRSSRLGCSITVPAVERLVNREDAKDAKMAS